jgi:hypothetical protein
MVVSRSKVSFWQMAAPVQEIINIIIIIDFPIYLLTRCSVSQNTLLYIRVCANSVGINIYIYIL